MSQPQLAVTPEGYVLTWPDLPITLSLSRLHEHRNRLDAELKIQHVNGTGTSHLLKQQTWNLLAGQTQTRLAKELAHRLPSVPWEDVLEQTCMLTLQVFRQGEPVVSLEPSASDHPAWFVLNPILYYQNPTVLYGPGGSMKSFLALYLGMLLASGQSQNGFQTRVEPHRVLYLDYEMTAADLRGRTKWLRAGSPTLTATPDYRRCFRPFAEDLSELQKIVPQGGYEILIIDSLALAAGGAELEKAEAPQRFNAALRSLNVTSLLIGHTPKDRDGDSKERTLYGNVFFRNLARSVWEIRKEDQTLACFHRKNNLGPEFPSVGLRLELHAELEYCHFVRESIDADPELRKGLSYPAQMKACLTTANRTTKQLLDLIDAKPETIRRNLTRYDGKWWTRVTGEDDRTEWTLLAPAQPVPRGASAPS